MNVHEYQAKQLMRKYGVAVPEGILVTTPEDAEAAAKELGGDIVVVKAQIHAGGRGKGGGVKLAKSPAEAKEIAGEILGMMLKTHQTGPDGMLVRKVYVEAGCDIDREMYLGIVLDRASEKFAIMASTEGGMDIETVAAKTPEKIKTVFVDPNLGLQDYQVRQLGFALELDPAGIKTLNKFLNGLYKLYAENDASIAEINPLVVTKGGEILALDGKLNFDDSGLFRHPEIAELRDKDEEDATEAEAAEWDLSYVSLDGDIGCMVNGAGLAMATLDVIALQGGQPANFLDVGGDATKERVAKAFSLILSDDAVKAVLVNIFGGIVRCDLIAQGVIAAAKELGIEVPVVVRLQGTKSEEGRKLLDESGLKLISAETLQDAAEKAVAAAKGDA